MMDPQSAAETRDEVKRAAGQAEPALDERGLPANYKFDGAWELTPRQVKAMLDGGEKFRFIDCRQSNEVEITKIEGTELIPLQQLAARLGDLRGRESEKIVVHCRSGGRSMKFAQLLRQLGFRDVWSMAGGILLWNRDINPGGPQY